MLLTRFRLIVRLERRLVGRSRPLMGRLCLGKDCCAIGGPGKRCALVNARDI